MSEGLRNGARVSQGRRDQAGSRISRAEQAPALSVDPPGDDQPRWTLPPRKEISPENLHISSFVLAKRKEAKGGESILLLKAGEKHPLSFRRGNLLLPATILRYGETPRAGARRALGDQLQEPSLLKDPEFAGMQSYFGAHWDLVLLFGSWFEGGDRAVIPKPPYVEAAFYDVSKLPRDEMAEDHLEVLEKALNPSEDD